MTTALPLASVGALRTRARLMLPVLAALATPGAGASAQALAPDVLFERIAPSVWMVQTADAQGRPQARGSAVVVAPGRLVTNCHVLVRAAAITVRRENVSYGATREFSDPERDLCQLKVANFGGPPVELADTRKLRVGARVFAIGNPRGLELTLSDGLISGLRRNERDELELVQTTAPISPGSSGGGLFDAEGRLVGITTAGVKDSQNLNFAVPAHWILELPARAQAVPDARTAPPVAAPVAPRAPGDGPQPGDEYEYAVTDQLTQVRQVVVLRVDGNDGRTVRLNGGTRRERVSGEVIELTQALAGELDAAMPPGGWTRPEMEPGQTWDVRYRAGDPVSGSDFRWAATVVGPVEVTVGAGTFAAVLVRYRGHVARAVGGRVPGGYQGPAEARVWWAPGLRRVVRFEFEARPAFSAIERQTVELVRVDRAR